MKRMKSHTKLCRVLITLTAILILTGVASSVQTQAKTMKPYKTETIQLVEGESKTYAFKSKIKKVKKISKNKAFSVKILSGKYRIKVSGTHYNTQQTVKVYYKNGKTQKVNLKTEVNYLNKIKAELKPMLADLDKGLRTAISQWETKLEQKNNSVKYIFRLHCDYDGINDENTAKTPDSLTIDEVIAKYTPSQKKAFILQVYCRSRMTYSYKNKSDYSSHRKSNAQFKKLYNGTFKGVCIDGAYMAMDIANAVGFTTRCIGARELNHSWCIVKATDTNGNNYWQGVFATSDGYNMNSGFNANKANYTKAYLSKYSYSPARSMIVTIKRPKNYVDLNPTTPTTQSTGTATAIKCPGCTGNIQHNAKNPYKTNKPFSYGNYGVWMYIHNGGGVIRLYDENGNEYPEVVELAKDILKNYL